MPEGRPTRARLEQRLSVVRRRLLNRVRGTVDRDRMVKEGLELGRNVYIAAEVMIAPINPWLVSIGTTRWSPRVQIYAHDASTRREIGYTRIGRVRIGANVFVGASSIVLPGVTIGDGAIVGAGSVVHHDVPSRMIVVGNPAEVLMSVDEYMAKQRVELADKPTYGLEWTLAGDISRNAA